MGGALSEHEAWRVARHVTCYTSRARDAVYDTVLGSIILYSTMRTIQIYTVQYSKANPLRFSHEERKRKMMVSKNRAESCPYFALSSVPSARDPVPGGRLG